MIFLNLSIFFKYLSSYLRTYATFLFILIFSFCSSSFASNNCKSLLAENSQDSKIQEQKTLPDFLTSETISFRPSIALESIEELVQLYLSSQKKNGTDSTLYRLYLNRLKIAYENGLDPVEFQNHLSKIIAENEKRKVLNAQERKRISRQERIFNPSKEFFKFDVIENSDEPISALALSPDSKIIAIAHKRGTEIKLWDLSTGKQIRTFNKTNNHTGNIIYNHTGNITYLAFSNDYKLLVSGSVDNTAKIWNVQTGKLVHTLVGHTSAINTVAFSHNSKRVVTASQDSTAKIWNVQTGEHVLTLSGSEGRTIAIYSVAFSHDSQRVVTGSWDGTAKIWNAKTGKLVFTLGENDETIFGIFSVAYSHDSQLVATGSWTGTAGIWNAHTGELVHILGGKDGHKTPIYSVAFSPDSQFVATGSVDKSVKIWDRHTGDIIQTLIGHTAVVSFVAFSLDSKSLVTASKNYDDNTVRIWRPFDILDEEKE